MDPSTIISQLILRLQRTGKDQTSITWLTTDGYTVTITVKPTKKINHEQ